FGLLQQRMHVGSAVEARRRAATTPAIYMAFDVLHVDGEDTTSLPYLERRARLREVLTDGPFWQIPGHHVGDGQAMLAASKERGLEGLVAKQVDSRYEIGRRSPCWIKVKNKCRQELVVGGWLPGEGGRSGQIGALLVGYYEGDELRFAGRVGTGYTQRELKRLGGLLAELARATSPFTPPPPAPVLRLAHWVEPDLVAEVEFTEWTREGILRHPSYQGLRIDKNAREVVRET
ncbi:MAG: non-homologous end-joining DNA ligase, partial [Actinomycetota bacterium]